MSICLMNRRAVLSRLARNLTGLGLAANSQVSARQEPAYRSPYRLRFRHAVVELEAGFAAAPWNSAQFESAVPAQECFTSSERGARRLASIRRRRPWSAATRPGCRIG